MSCLSCGSNDNPNRPEHKRFFKPENNNGCGCGGGNGNCDTPSLAKEGTPLWNWEQIYGKLVTTITFEQDEWGRTVQKVEKKPCGLPPVKSRNQRCCSLRYKVVR